MLLHASMLCMRVHSMVCLQYPLMLASYQQRSPASPLPLLLSDKMLALALIHLRIRFCRRGYLAALAKAEAPEEAPAEEALAAAEADAAEVDVAGDADVAAGDSVSPEADSVPATSLEAPSTRWVPFADGHGTMVPFLWAGAGCCQCIKRIRPSISKCMCPAAEDERELPSKGTTAAAVVPLTLYLVKSFSVFVPLIGDCPSCILAPEPLHPACLARRRHFALHLAPAAALTTTIKHADPGAAATTTLPV